MKTMTKNTFTLRARLLSTFAKFEESLREATKGFAGTLTPTSAYRDQASIDAIKLIIESLTIAEKNLLNSSDSAEPKQPLIGSGLHMYPTDTQSRP